MATDMWRPTIERMLARVRDTAAQLDTGLPHWADPETGHWTTMPNGDWTGGYFIGMLWLAAAATGEARYREWAAPLAELLVARIAAETVFKSFPAYYGAALGSILADAARPRETALATARHMARHLYVPALGLVPLGAQAEEGAHIGGTEASIDSLQAAPFLFWAAAASGETALGAVAAAHADRVIALHLRSDGSFIQSSSLDPATGELVRHYTHKGVSDRSTWGRAQAWGMLFATQCWLADRARTPWLAAAERGARWWLDHVPADYVAFWDFDDPAIPATERDTAATAIALAALLRLARLAPSASDRARYAAAAEATTEALVQRHLTPIGPDDHRPPGMLIDACFNKRPDARPQDRVSRCEFVVGSYYLLESLLALSGALDPLRL
jgi:unsaturated chondroitin disaccharide hydrolase